MAFTTDLLASVVHGKRPALPPPYFDLAERTCMTNHTAIVKFDHVEKRYGDGPVILDQISFAAKRGDFISLIGPSGCGKSTILKLISGLNPITSGVASVEGVSPENAAQELAFVFQEPTLLPWLNVQRNVEVPLKLRGVESTKRAKIALQCLDLVGLAGRATYYPRQLSGGQKMRVSIARALSLSPKILLLDEPFGALDEMTRDHLNEELLGIRDQKAWTAFFVTHSVAEAVFLSNRIFVLSANPGRLHREIPVDLPYPRTEETRQSPDYQRLVAEVSKLLRSVENAQP
ncbi:ABC transporter ATP-binding protein [Synoicihabitans lomoniglobus]|uniref:ABC transporter ATP-binding protein n=1 Tax=Synoicihabitans lomoniglobus TaxID=2909285 RepID=A0AAF0I480_9BACT|nr:ABC transporter ATP-binding protein [Opitutaceae bacterium LMO-M01]WED66614.1 ABC transporter ATP-binding protein [Opitutaceae bacterium LMO-M01]